MRTIKRATPLAVLVAALACSPMHLEAPAPDGALECALDLGLGLGYEPTAGGIDSGFIRLERHELLGMEQTITVTQVRGVLRIQASGRMDEGETVSPDGQTKEDAQRILDTCSAG